MNDYSELKNHIKKLCDERKMYLISTDISQLKGGNFIKVVVDTDAGVTLNQCQELSREISDIIFRKELMERDYNLEVTSPGVNKPLENEYEFKRNIGRNVRVRFWDETPENKEKELTGELKNYNSDFIEIEAKGQKFEIKFGQIIEVKIKLKW